MEPVIVQCSSACTVTLQLEQVGPFSLSVEDGYTLSMLIIAVWLSAVLMKALIRVVPQNHDA
jgi:hypothetical protein